MTKPPNGKIALWGVLIVILSIVAILPWMVSAAISAAGQAETRVDVVEEDVQAVDHRLDIHEKEQNGTLKHISMQLESITQSQAEIKEGLEYQRRKLEEALRERHEP